MNDRVPPLAARDYLFRLMPHATEPGLRRIGDPGPDSPVLVTGNYALTVRRMMKQLDGRDAWLLVANSRGINVWCAAGGGHLSHHDVIAAVRMSGLADHVSHRLLILPQLGATGIERREITEATGFETRWGPARLEDIPAFLDRGQRARIKDRLMRFPLRERIEMATMWALPMAPIIALILWAIAGLRAGLSIGVAVLVVVYGLFVALPWLPMRRSVRWLTYAGIASTCFGVSALLLLAVGSAGATTVAWAAVASGVATVVLVADLAGSTPWYASTINSFRNHFDIDLIEERCTGAADCVLVCPRGVLRMDGVRRKVELLHAEDCIGCGACVVQCPEDALRFRFPDGRVVEAPTVRATRMNMVGRRAVTMPRSAG